MSEAGFFRSGAADVALAQGRLAAMFEPTRRLPASPFRSTHPEWRVVEFDLLFSSHMPDLMRALTEAAGDGAASFGVIEPDAGSYFGKRFGVTPICDIREGQWPAFVDACHAAPPGSEADAVAIVSRTVAFASPTGAWGIWGEREREVAIIGASSEAIAALARRPEVGAMVMTLDEAIVELLPQTFRPFGVPDAFADELRRAFPPGQG